MRLAMIGTGRIATRFVKELNAYNSNAENDGTFEKISLTAIVNPNIEHAKTFIDKNIGINTESNKKPLALSGIDKLKEITDAVYISSPHETHYPYAGQALKMGLNVLCEKPLAFNPEFAKELYDIASSGGLVFMEAVKTAYCPGFREIERIIRAGIIGNVVDVDAAFTRLTAPGVREYSDKRYGGSFTEFGSYTMLPILRFLGCKYNAVSFYSRDEYGVDGYTRTVFDYPGRYASSKTGLSVKTEGQLVISGTKGYILVPSPWWLTRYFEVRFEDPAKIERHECEFAGDGLRYEIAEFATRIDNGVGAVDKETVEMERSESVTRAAVYERFLTGRTANGQEL